MTDVASISQQIWDMKYRLKGPDGAPVDKTIDDTWRRVARALAAPERDAARWAREFFDVLADFRFLPAGRIVAGAGTERAVTLFNCFVMGTIPDDMAGIFEHLKEAALTMQQGGGIGHDFSTLRPRGAPVRGVGADASGPLSFMDVWDAMCRTIMSAGHRRGAMMATLRCDHPDIEAFIEAKREPGRLRMFNLSVLVTDAFMAAVKDDRPWPLSFGGTAFKSLPARELWDKIMRATYAYAEPGVIFIDRVNRRNPLAYCETINATNPCITAESWIQTADGPRQVRSLIGKKFVALVDGAPFASDARGFFATGRKPVLRLATKEGYALRLTGDHLVRRAASLTRHRIGHEWVPARDLRPGDRIVLHNHRKTAQWAGQYGEAEGYLIGLLIGDGTLKSDKAVLSAWPGRRVVNSGFEREGVRGIMDAALAAAMSLPHRGDFTGWVEVAGRGERRLALGAVKRIALDLGMAPGRKQVTPAIEASSSDFHRGFLRGLFDADGCVSGDQTKGVSIRLAQSDPATLEAAQRMLLRLGIASQIYRERRPEGWRELPDGRGGKKSYRCAADHELSIAGDNVARFHDSVGFADGAKRARLTALLGAYKRQHNRERFVAEVRDICPDGETEVYDAAVPGINAFDANGLYVHNCGEQPLPPYGACLLGSINLPRFVAEPFAPGAALDLAALARVVGVAVRMMDNVTDISKYPLPQQRDEALAKRRIGLGVTGLADALILVGKRYGSPESLRLAELWMSTIQHAAYRASSELAREKGAFPLFDRDKYLAGETILGLPDDVRAAIARDGLRNGLLTSIAPTGTISLFADNVSSGIEPVFARTYTRQVLLPDGGRREEEVSDHAYRLYRRLKGPEAPLPESFVDAQHLAPKDHVAMQAAVQKYIDSSISKTINCPENIGFDAFRDVYRLAYDMGCKGCTTYRPNEITGAVLSTKTAAPERETEPELPLPKIETARAKDAFESGGIVYMTQPLDRPEALPGSTYKIRWPDSVHAIYITINDVIQDGRRRPFEVFINSKNMEHFAWTVGLTRMISAVFRRGGDVSFVVDELKAVFDPRGGQWMGRRYVPSLLAAIGDVIERHMIDIGFIPSAKEAREGQREFKVVGGRDIAEDDGEGGAPERPAMRGCTRCGRRAVIRQEGCDLCTQCGYSKCA